MRPRFAGRFISLGLALVLASMGCGDDSSGPDTSDTPPELPPLGSMEPDLTLWDQGIPGPNGGAAGAVPGEGLEAVAGLHFTAAAFSVGVARTATVAVMAFPTTLFAAAASEDPVFEDGAFHWRFTAMIFDATISADLSGHAQGSSSFWEMRVTTTGTEVPVEDFLWYSGRASLNGQGGEWHLFDTVEPESGTEVLELDWSRPADDRWTLTFTNVDPDSPGLGDMLEYEADGDLRRVRYFDASLSRETSVEWNAVTGEGFIEAEGYNDGERGCWNADFEDTPCGG